MMSTPANADAEMSSAGSVSMIMRRVINNSSFDQLPVVVLELLPRRRRCSHRQCGRGIHDTRSNRFKQAGITCPEVFLVSRSHHTNDQVQLRICQKHSRILASMSHALRTKNVCPDSRQSNAVSSVADRRWMHEVEARLAEKIVVEIGRASCRERM